MNLSRLMVPASLIGPLIATALGAGGSYLVTQQKVEEISVKTEKQHAEVEKLKEQRVDQSERLKGVETELQSVNRALERIERKLDEK